MLPHKYPLHLPTLSLQILYDPRILLLALSRPSPFLLHLLQLGAQRSLELQGLTPISACRLQLRTEDAGTLVQMLHVQLEHFGLLLQATVVLAQGTLGLRQRVALQAHGGQALLGVLEPLLQLLDLQLEGMLAGHTAGNLLDGRAESADQVLGELPTPFSL